MIKYCFTGLEIAPTRVFPIEPYDTKTGKVQKWSQDLKEEFGFCVPSIQSIWYGKQEKIFGSPEERKFLTNYTKKAIDFAATIGCKNLVFGCPRNRSAPANFDRDIAISFFRELGDYAADKGTVIGVEANPSIYNTNFINTTSEALKLIKDVDSAGLLLNLDIGTMIYNRESISELCGQVRYISHVHISEPGLKPVEKRHMHKELKQLLSLEKYAGYISIEMTRQENISVIEGVLNYVKDLFTD